MVGQPLAENARLFSILWGVVIGAKEIGAHLA
jgi:hypothetical protein